MTIPYSIIKKILFKLDPETAHDLAINILSYAPRFCSLFANSKNYDNLAQDLFGLHFSNPIGLAAGFDKNGKAIKSLANFGFGFIEVGTVTPKAQLGNAKPRLFRLNEDEAIINRFGFNNAGAEAMLQNVVRNKNCLLGINIGKNKDSANDASDYIYLLNKFSQHCSYITINISSPNTANLRELQQIDQLSIFLTAIKDCYQKIDKKPPIFLKVAPDLTIDQQQLIANLVLQHNWISALIVSNTTIDRNNKLINKQQTQSGGLSGKPLFALSTAVLANFYRFGQGQIKLIGVGGISNGEQAYQKIIHGASLLQLYSALIYNGFGLVERIKAELSQILQQQGFTNIAEAIGIAIK